MPAGQPFTHLCQQTARSRPRRLADLHLHTTHSDGTCTPAQLVELARRAGLSAIAVTDHDTLGGVPAARAVSASAPSAGWPALEIIAGVEITASFRNRELHLLGYFVRLDDPNLNAALAQLREHRVGRFWEMVGRLRACGASVDEDTLRAEATAMPATHALGRRHLAAHLVRIGRVGSVREAFARYLGDHGRAAVPKLRLPVAEAIGLVRVAAGVAAWAHPPYDCTRDDLLELRALGLGAVEVDCPQRKPHRAEALRRLADEMGLAVSGGSDFHEPGLAYRAIGTHGVTGSELAGLRRLTSDGRPPDSGSGLE